MLTALSCRALAAEDTARAAATVLPNRRHRFEASAEAWNERADMLERIGRLNAGRNVPERLFDRG